jgi:hypothetical protein
MRFFIEALQPMDGRVMLSLSTESHTIVPGAIDFNSPYQQTRAAQQQATIGVRVCSLRILRLPRLARSSFSRLETSLGVT